MILEWGGLAATDFFRWPNHRHCLLLLAVITGLVAWRSPRRPWGLLLMATLLLAANIKAQRIAPFTATCFWFGLSAMPLPQLPGRLMVMGVLVLTMVQMRHVSNLPGFGVPDLEQPALLMKTLDAIPPAEEPRNILTGLTSAGSSRGTTENTGRSRSIPVRSSATI